MRRNLMELLTGRGGPPDPGLSYCVKNAPRISIRHPEGARAFDGHAICASGEDAWASKDDRPPGFDLLIVSGRRPPISGLPEIGLLKCASRLKSTCDGSARSRRAPQGGGFPDCASLIRATVVSALPCAK